MCGVLGHWYCTQVLVSTPAFEAVCSFKLDVCIHSALIGCWGCAEGDLACTKEVPLESWTSLIHNSPPPPPPVTFSLARKIAMEGNSEPGLGGNLLKMLGLGPYVMEGKDQLEGQEFIRSQVTVESLHPGSLTANQQRW